eukprot:15775513-Heterocapsa_arctica.AAC.1
METSRIGGWQPGKLTLRFRLGFLQFPGSLARLCGPVCSTGCLCIGTGLKASASMRRQWGPLRVGSANGRPPGCVLVRVPDPSTILLFVANESGP